MKSVLVTGVNGFVGNHLIKELADNGMKVIGIGGSQGSAKSALLDSYLVLDLNNPKDVRRIDFKSVDSVVHLAGLAAVGPSFDEPMRYIDTNIGIEVNLFEEAIRQGSKPKFLIISSGSLYDPKASLPLTEESAVAPNSPYAVSKLGQEQTATYYTSRGFECVIARPFNHIGPGQSPGFIVPDIAMQIVDIEHGDASELLVGNLEAQRDYTDVRDIVRAYRLLLDGGKSGEIYNVCSGKAVSGQTILDKLLEISGKKLGVRQDAAKLRPTDNPLLYGAYDKLSDATGWQPEIKLQQSLADALANCRAKD